MAKTVLLKHELPDGSWHYDWLLARSDTPGDPDDRVLIAFRVTVPPWDTGVQRFPAARLDDHRVAYLTYEGPISGNRGIVTRLREGLVDFIQGTHPHDSQGLLVVQIDFGEGPRQLRGWLADDFEGDRWVFADQT